MTNMFVKTLRSGVDPAARADGSRDKTASETLPPHARPGHSPCYENRTSVRVIDKQKRKAATGIYLFIQQRRDIIRDFLPPPSQWVIGKADASWGGQALGVAKVSTDQCQANAVTGDDASSRRKQMRGENHEVERLNAPSAPSADPKPGQSLGRSPRYAHSETPKRDRRLAPRGSPPIAPQPHRRAEQSSPPFRLSQSEARRKPNQPRSILNQRSPDGGRR